MTLTSNVIDLAEKRKEKMSTAVAKVDLNEISAIEKVLFNGDLKDLTPEQRVTYVNRVCESLGLNPTTQPFNYMNLGGKLVLYARKDCTEQLRKIHSVSIRKLTKEVIEGIYTVSALAELPNGRSDESTGCVSIQGLRGDALANAYMKAETKAKRRVTLSICGLGMLDETELETIPGAATHVESKPVSNPKPIPVKGNLRENFKNSFIEASKTFMTNNPTINMKELLMERYGVTESKDLDDSGRADLFYYMLEDNQKNEHKQAVLTEPVSTVTTEKPSPNAVNPAELPWTKHLPK